MLGLDDMVSEDIELDLVFPVPGNSALPSSPCTIETDLTSSLPKSSPSADPGWPTSFEVFTGKIESWKLGCDTPSGRGSGRISGE